MFWKNEITGKMAEIVKKYFNKSALNDFELKTLKEYIIQWIENTTLPNCRPPNFRVVIIEMNQDQLYNYVPNVLLDYGIDPF